MADDATATSITDPEAASHALASMAARAEVLRERLGGLTSRIAGLEAAQPWGSAQEYGGRFLSVYDGGTQGAAFVRQHVESLATETADGAGKAHQALTGSVELDKEGASLFRTDGADQVAQIAETARQQEQAEVAAE